MSDLTGTFNNVQPMRAKHSSNPPLHLVYNTCIFYNRSRLFYEADTADYSTHRNDLSLAYLLPVFRVHTAEGIPAERKGTTVCRKEKKSADVSLCWYFRVPQTFICTGWFHPYSLWFHPLRTQHEWLIYIHNLCLKGYRPEEKYTVLCWCGCSTTHTVEILVCRDSSWHYKSIIQLTDHQKK